MCGKLIFYDQNCLGFTLDGLEIFEMSRAQEVHSSFSLQCMFVATSEVLILPCSLVVTMWQDNSQSHAVAATALDTHYSIK